MDHTRPAPPPEDPAQRPRPTNPDVILVKDTRSERREFRRRIVVAGIAMLIGAFGLLGRMYYLQRVKHEHFSTRADQNRMRIEVVPGVRGLIYDRDGVVLAENQPAYRLEIVPEQVPGELDATLDRLGELITIEPHDRERFKDRVARSAKFHSVALRLNMTPVEVARIEVNRQDFPGVDVRAGLTRHYPLGHSTSHVVGYVGGITARDLERVSEAEYQGTSQIGKSGVERQYESRLHGSPGSKLVEVNALGRHLRELDYTRPAPGMDLVLTLSSRLQQVAEQELGDRRGAAVALDVRNGDVLALVSVPTFDPHLFVDGIGRKQYAALLDDDDQPLFNRALQGSYPPGSTIKPVMALAGIDNEVFQPHSQVYCPGYFSLPDSQRRHRDWKRRGHGHVDMHEAIAQSCDVYFYDLANRLGVDRIHEFLEPFGLGRPTGIDLPGEGGGLLPSREWKRSNRHENWYPGETLNIGIGQGFMLATPLQMAQLAARIANRGLGFVPHALKAVHDPTTRTTTPVDPQALPPITLQHEELWDRVHRAMTAVAHSATGTARRIGVGADYLIAGKTGTAQVSGLSQEDDIAPQLEDVPEHLRDHSLFIGFAPADDPRVAVAVIAENSGGGSAVAAPIARHIFDAAISQLSQE